MLVVNYGRLVHCKNNLKKKSNKKKIFFLRNGKFAGIFFSTATMGGGQETTAYFTVPVLVHLGISFVPIGGINKKIGDNSQVHGGTAWGSG
jgi:hypothetical protein